MDLIVSPGGRTSVIDSINLLFFLFSLFLLFLSLTSFSLYLYLHSTVSSFYGIFLLSLFSRFHSLAFFSLFLFLNIFFFFHQVLIILFLNALRFVSIFHFFNWLYSSSSVKTFFSISQYIKFFLRLFFFLSQYLTFSSLNISLSTSSPNPLNSSLSVFFFFPLLSKSFHNYNGEGWNMGMFQFLL